MDFYNKITQYFDDCIAALKIIQIKYFTQNYCLEFFEFLILQIPLWDACSTDGVWPPHNLCHNVNRFGSYHGSICLEDIDQIHDHLGLKGDKIRKFDIKINMQLLPKSITRFATYCQHMMSTYYTKYVSKSIVILFSTTLVWYCFERHVMNCRTSNDAIFTKCFCT